MKLGSAKQIAAVFMGLGLIGISGAEGAEKKKMSPQSPKTEIAAFAGGCFWCMQPPFDKAKGVISTLVGYAGGTKKIQPTKRSARKTRDTWNPSR